MGQKINPIGFRLGTTQDHHSLWFEEPKNYSEGLQQDQEIRNYIKNYIQENMKISKDLGWKVITCIEIQKEINLIHVITYLGFSNKVKEKRPEKKKKLAKEEKEEITKLQMNLHKEFPFIDRLTCDTIKFNLTFKVFKNPFENPTVLAAYLADQLKNRVSFRKAMKKTIELSQEAGTKGIQVKIAGRIGGREIARVVCFKKGRLPLQTVRAKIDYCSYPVQTTYGVLGIKIWTFEE
uniref:Small ribosomal subunit protein uS3c n=1 Tax=Scaevola taccada TaxID=16481 RepID=A0A411JY05_SCATA|nr:ribosomal protein S3 [Scaevola taccada]QBC69970.1 ribosomal protein S3 [Scaevola taccada]